MDTGMDFAAGGYMWLHREKLPAGLKLIYDAYGPDYNFANDNPAREIVTRLFPSTHLTPEAVKRTWERVDRYFEPRPVKEYFSGNSRSGDWLKLCRKTFRDKLPELKRAHPGQCVAISATEVVEAGNLIELFRKYQKPETPPVEFFYVPAENDAGKNNDLCTPTTVFPEY